MPSVPASPSTPPRASCSPKLSALTGSGAEVIYAKQGKNKGKPLQGRSLHRWIARRYGKASEHACVDCGKQAKDWSWIHDTDESEPRNYVPRCQSCHLKYDFTEERRNKITAALHERERKPETYIKVSAAQKGKPRPWQRGVPRSDETKARSSAAQKGKPKPQSGVKCAPGCTCKRHDYPGKICPPGCTCRRHGR